jgi:hypothetical protein
MGNSTDHALIVNLLDRYGWNWRKTNEGSIVTGFQGMYGNFMLSFDLKEDWLVIFTADYLPMAIEGKQKDIYPNLLRLNSEYPYTRFAMTPEGKIFIVVDVVIGKDKNVDFSAFRLAMDLICEAADRFYPALYEKITGEDLSQPNKEQL